MLSNHEFCQAVEEIYPKVVEIESQLLELFNKQYLPGRGRGITGFRGDNELHKTIELLQSSLAFLRSIAKKQNIDVEFLFKE